VDARPPHPLPLAYENWPTMPTVLYRGMLQPLAPLAITGALWYQGEANFTRAAQYRTLLPALIADWRALFRQPDLPFYVISLPAFMPRRDQPGSDGWAELREAQAETVRTVPHTGLVVTVDTGDAANIHPPDKQPVGERAALQALRETYGRGVVSHGPVFERAEKIGGALRLHFTHTEGGLVVRGDKLGEFAVAGADRVWHWADAKLDGDRVIVSSPAVPDPVFVSYAWQANPLATLFNGAGLPAAPFRTDH
jgi:sialate O-acetylesterase